MQVYRNVEKKVCVTVYLQCDEVGVKVNTNDIGRRVKEVKVARVHPCNK